MAVLHPHNWQQLQHLPEHRGEWRTLQCLQRLPDDYVVIHGAHWTKLQRHYLISRELDFCVVTPAGGLIVIEQKNGHLIERDGRFFKRYAPEVEKDVSSQLLQARDGLMQNYNKATRDQLHCDVLLYCPDHRVDGAYAGGLPENRVVDQRRASQLLRIVQSLNGGPADPERKKALVRFLLGHFNLRMDVGESLRLGDHYYAQLSGELGEQVRQIEFNPWSLRLQGSAGAGKTQLAVHLLEEAVQAGQRALYLCFNRPLADRMRTICDARACIETRDSLTDHFLRSQGISPDYGEGQSADFARLRAQVMDTAIPPDWRFDLIIIDEGQDFSDDDAQLFLYFMHEEARRTRLLWMEDPLQNIYGKVSGGSLCPVTLHSQRDFRSPAELLDFSLAYLGLDTAITAMNPVAGVRPRVHTYRDGVEQMRCLEQAVAHALQQGCALDDLVLVSLKGLEHHLLHDEDHLGAWPLRRFTGRYTDTGVQVWTEGELTVETIYRFKGQQAAWVIVIDIEGDWTQRQQRKLYCALTRATYSATVLIHADTEQARQRSVVMNR